MGYFTILVSEYARSLFFYTSFFVGKGRKSEGEKGVSGGVWECGKLSQEFSIISMPQSEGKKGEVTFSLRRQRRRSFAPPFSPSFPAVITVIIGG